MKKYPLWYDALAWLTGLVLLVPFIMAGGPILLLGIGFFVLVGNLYERAGKDSTRRKASDVGSTPTPSTIRYHKVSR